jgi:hypothetical protein
MPQCVKCKEFFDIGYCMDILPDDPNDDASICVFCKLGLKEITIQYDDGDKKVTKDDAIRAYREYIGNITRNKKIKNIIENGKQSKIIMPGDREW